MDRFLLPEPPDAPLGATPFVVLVGGQMLASVAIGALASQVTSSTAGWVSIVAAVVVAQVLGAWWERRRPGSVTVSRRRILALSTVVAQFIPLVGYLSMVAMTDRDALPLVAGVGVFGLVVTGLATWWSLGLGVRLAATRRS